MAGLLSCGNRLGACSILDFVSRKDQLSPVATWLMESGTQTHRASDDGSFSPEMKYYRPTSDAGVNPEHKLPPSHSDAPSFCQGCKICPKTVLPVNRSSGSTVSHGLYPLKTLQVIDSA